MTWACCVWERVSVHVASLVAGAWESQCAWIWLRLTGEIWKSFNWPDCKDVKISHPVMRWHMQCLWNKSHGGTHTCETDHTLAHICETKHALAHMSMCLWNQSHVGIHVYDMDLDLAHMSVKLVTHWHTGFLLGSISQTGVMYTCVPAMYTWRDAHLHVDAITIRKMVWGLFLQSPVNLNYFSFTRSHVPPFVPAVLLDH